MADRLYSSNMIFSESTAMRNNPARVGDSSGWSSRGLVDYNEWTSTKDFYVGDTIIFAYNNQFHNVMQVTNQDYESCNPTSPIAVYTSGSDNITLDGPGNFYFLVGDSNGWTSRGLVDYSEWASTKDFHVNDTLIFAYNNQFHNVMQVTTQDFDSCNPNSPVTVYTSGSDTITLDRPGNFYFLCGAPVGDFSGWSSRGLVDYNEWASTKDFHVGDTLTFSYNNQFHNVMQVTNEDYESCNPASPIAVYASGSDTITLERPDNFYFLCGAPGHCQAGQRVEILATLPTPDDSFTGPSPTPSASPADTMSPSSALSSSPALHFSKLGLGVTIRDVIIVVKIYS
ncbi:Cupredoxin superfamily protein [Prunus dulcis]|uniref:Cupredoxin superfamily protein n=1 Tax=Prunus dulcis TaxID=3755 RepID=A0A4Y1RD65_PRUDU|nr:Cupredoxin superfamily protein [Prunus dulcis]